MKFLPFVAALILAFMTSAEAAAATRPNVIIIYTDDQGSVDVNCYGAKDLITPNMDRLAATGVRFTQMYAPSAICSASRAGLMTGRIPARAGVPGNVSSEKGKAGMPTTEVTIAELLKRNGYATGHIGKWHLGYTPETMPNSQGFDYSFGHMGGCIDNYSHFFYWVGPNRHDLWRQGKEVWRDGEYFGDMMVNEVKGFISENKAKPFFIYWAINWPHYPLQGTDKWRRKYAKLPHPRDKYATFISTTDEYIGRVVDYLDVLGLRQNTIVIFQSDHGHSVEERTFGGGGSAGPYRGHKGNLFEGGIRVPSIVSWPAGFPKGEVRDQFVVGTDWWPTIAALTGSKIPDGHKLDGKNITDVIRQPDAMSPHDDYYWQLGKGKNAQWVVRSGDWKLYANARENVKPDQAIALTGKDRPGFLANLSQDVAESRNVASEQPAVLKRLQSIAERYQADIGE